MLYILFANLLSNQNKIKTAYIQTYNLKIQYALKTPEKLSL